MHIRGSVISAFRHRDGSHVVCLYLYDKIYKSLFHFHHIKPELDAATRTRARNRYGPYIGVPMPAEPQEVAFKENERLINYPKIYCIIRGIEIKFQF